MIVTFVPNAEKMWANSAAMTPPPMMMRLFHGAPGNLSPKNV
jgi:hypothetical protein